MTTVLVPPERIVRWVENFETRHGAVVLAAGGGSLTGSAADGSSFAAGLPFSREFAGPPELEAFLAAGEPPSDWGILLVRKGGFAVGHLAGRELVASKVGQRHVQGRTKAGGQSQQRFARRRDNQARDAFAAAAEHAARLIPSVPVLVVGGEDRAVVETLKDPRLRALGDRLRGQFLTVPDPRRAVLESAIEQACSVRIVVTNA